MRTSICWFDLGHAVVLGPGSQNPVRAKLFCCMAGPICRPEWALIGSHIGAKVACKSPLLIQSQIRQLHGLCGLLNNGYDNYRLLHCLCCLIDVILRIKGNYDHFGEKDCPCKFEC